MAYTVRLTTSILYLLVDEAKEKYYNSKQSKAGKELLRNIFPIFHIVWKPRASFRARAWAININYKKTSERTEFKLSKLIHPYTRIGWGDYFMLIEMEATGVKFISRRILANIVSHELAHLLQIAEKRELDSTGKSSISNKETDHEPLWQEMHKAMGGNGKTTVAL